MAPKPRRTTVYVEPDLHRALRLKAAETERSVSELINEAIKRSLEEDAEDLAAFARRSGEQDLAFEAVLAELKRRGTL